jgi:hypothetical protein
MAWRFAGAVPSPSYGFVTGVGAGAGAARVTKVCPVPGCRSGTAEPGLMRREIIAASIALAAVLACPGPSRAPALAQTPDCSAAAMPAALSIRGTITEEDATGPFERTIDMRTGFSRTSRENGIERSLSGFNGVAWGFGNGIPSVIDVPPLVPNAAARAFVARLGWNDASVRPSGVARDGGTVERTYDLPQMSRVVVFSTTDLARPSRVTVDADWGVETTAFSDWRCAGGVKYPFEQKQTEATGETQVTHVTSVAATRVPPGTFDVPQSQAHGHITPASPAPFRFAGPRDRHIIVDATIGGTTVPLVFDTGARNYFGPKLAQAQGWAISGGSTITGVGNGGIAAGFARVPAMTIANATLNDEVADVAPLPWPDSANAAAGLTGFEFLAEFRTTIDYPNRTMTFASFADPVPSDGIHVPFKSIEHFPAIEATVNGVPGWFGVDTGDSDAITLFKRFADRAGVVSDPSLQRTTGGGVGGTVRFSQSRLRTFAIGGMSLAAPRVRLSEATAGAFASRSLAGNLGGGLFHCFRLTFDYRLRALWFASDPSTAACLQELSG